MNGPDAFNEELLSAYLDGELSPEERGAVDRFLEEHPEQRGLLGRLAQLDRTLGRLPRYSLSPGFTDRVVQAATAAAAELEFQDAAEEAWSDELLSGYLDGELSLEQRRRVEVALQRDERRQQELEELRRLNAQLDAMSQPELGEEFTQRVMRAVERAARQLHFPAQPRFLPERTEAVTVAQPRVRWRRAAAAVAALSATLLIALLALDRWSPRGNADRGTPEFALSPGDSPRPDDVRGADEDILAGEGDVLGDPASGGQLDPVAVPVIANAPRPPAIPRDTLPASDAALPMGGAEPLQFVAYAGNEYLMIYEITVSADGVEQDALEKLLNRHGIQMQNKLQLDSRQRQLLLKHRFLDAAGTREAATPEVDPLQLFLVSCRGWQVDALHRELMTRPAGLLSYGLNMTSRMANEAVLDNVCKASAAVRETGQAVELLAGLVLSRSTRQLGMFGMLNFDLRDLRIAPPRDPQGTDRLNAVGAWSEAELRGEMAVDLLFAVRNLSAGERTPSLDR